MAARTRTRVRQQRLPGIAEQATAAEEAVLAAGHRAHWYSPAASVAMQLHMRRSGLSPADRDHAALELALMGPWDSHDLSAAQLARLTGSGDDRHDIGHASSARVRVQERRRRLAAAGVLEIETRPGRSAVTRLGAVAALVIDAAEQHRRATADAVPPTGTAQPSSGTPDGYHTGTPDGYRAVPQTGTTLERGERETRARAARLPKNETASHHAADSPARQGADLVTWYCRRKGCEGTVQISRATGQPYDECLQCAT